MVGLGLRLDGDRGSPGSGKSSDSSTTGVCPSSVRVSPVADVLDADGGHDVAGGGDTSSVSSLLVGVHLQQAPHPLLVAACVVLRTWLPGLSSLTGVDPEVGQLADLLGPS